GFHRFFCAVRSTIAQRKGHGRIESTCPVSALIGHQAAPSATRPTARIDDHELAVSNAVDPKPLSFRIGHGGDEEVATVRQTDRPEHNFVLITCILFPLQEVELVVVHCPDSKYELEWFSPMNVASLHQNQVLGFQSQ